MALQTMGRAKSLSFTQVGNGGPSSPINSLQGYTFSRSKELAEFLQGTSRVQSHYSGTQTASIEVQISDLAAFAAFDIGQKYEDVVLTVESAVDSAGTAVGDEAEITLDQAIISEVGELSSENENSAPVVGSVTFTLSRHADAASDPEWSIEAVVGGEG